MKVELIDYMGDDLRVANAARVSFNKEKEAFDERDARLIRYLADHDHWTPFAHGVVTLRETVPIFVARQRFKHQIGFVYNEVSRRYVDDEPEFYTPDKWRGRPEGSLKQGSSNEEITHFQIADYAGETHEPEIGQYYSVFIDQVTRYYNALLAAGVAPEQARMVLPQSMYTSYYVTGSLAAFARAYKLRADPHAQLEIQELATQWDGLIKPLFPVSWTYLTRSGEYD